MLYVMSMNRFTTWLCLKTLVAVHVLVVAGDVSLEWVLAFSFCLNTWVRLRFRRHVYSVLGKSKMGTLGLSTLMDSVLIKGKACNGLEV